MGFSPGQQKHYRPMVARAWHAHCAATGTPPADSFARDAWYRQELVDALGVYTTKQCNKTTDFDLAMLHFATIVGDEAWIKRCSAGDERRVAHELRRLLRDLTFLENRKVDWSYVRGIYKQSGMLPERFEDAPVETMRKVLQMLDAHVRRLRRACNLQPCDLPSRSHGRVTVTFQSQLSIDVEHKIHAERQRQHA